MNEQCTKDEKNKTFSVITVTESHKTDHHHSCVVGLASYNSINLQRCFLFRFQKLTFLPSFQ